MYSESRMCFSNFSFGSLPRPISSQILKFPGLLGVPWYFDT